MEDFAWILFGLLGGLCGYAVAARKGRASRALVSTDDVMEVDEIIDRACKNGSAVLLLDTTSKERWNAHFGSLTDQELSLDVLNDDQPDKRLPQLAALLSVQFNYEGCGQVFLGRVLRSNSSGKTNQVVVHAPAEIGASESRVAFRVNVPAHINLVITATVNERTYALKVHDISPAGLRVSGQEITALPFSTRDRAQLDVLLDDQSCTVRATVQRVQAQSIGLRIPANKSTGAVAFRAIAHQVIELVESEKRQK